MAEPLKFPLWHQPAQTIGAILVHSQAELDALTDAGWPLNAVPKDDAPAPAAMTKADLIAALEAAGVKVDKSQNKAALAEQLAAL